MAHDIPGRFRSIMRRMQAILKSIGLAEIVRIDEDRLGRAIIDYFEDIDRLKDFEEIERVNVSKIYAYETYWLVRRKPIIVEDNVEENDSQNDRLVYINEIVCAMMLVMNMCTEVGKIPDPGNDQTKRFYELLYYNLRFRDFTAKSLELAIEAFMFGISVG